MRRTSRSRLQGHCSVVAWEPSRCRGSNNQQNSAQKRPRSSPTWRTPHKQQKRIPLRELTTDDDDAGSRLLLLRLIYETENISVESHNPLQNLKKCGQTMN